MAILPQKRESREISAKGGHLIPVSLSPLGWLSFRRLCVDASWVPCSIAQDFQSHFDLDLERRTYGNGKKILGLEAAELLVRFTMSGQVPAPLWAFISSLVK